MTTVTFSPTYMKDIVNWIQRGSPADNSLYGMWDAPDPGLSSSGHVQPGEGGVDLSVPIGTPVYALATGPVTAMGYWEKFPGDRQHGVITQRVDVPGAGPQDLYYQHIFPDMSLTPGTIVQRGQKIGVIGPFNEIEMGFNSGWGGVWGNHHPGPWIKDPRPWLAALLTGNPSPISSSGLPGTIDTGNFGLNALYASIRPSLVQWGEIIGVFLIALAFIIIGIYLLGGDPGQVVQAPINYVQARRETLKGS